MIFGAEIILDKKAMEAEMKRYQLKNILRKLDNI